MPAWTLVDGRVAYVLRAHLGSATGRAAGDRVRGRDHRHRRAPAPSADVITIWFPARTVRNEPVGSAPMDSVRRSWLSRTTISFDRSSAGRSPGFAGDVDACATGAEALRAVGQPPLRRHPPRRPAARHHGLDLAKKLVAHPNATSSGHLLRQRVAAPRRWRCATGSARCPSRCGCASSSTPSSSCSTWSRDTGAPPAARLAALDTLAADLLVS